MSSTITPDRRSGPGPAIAVREPLLQVLLCITTLLAACADNPSAIRDPVEDQQALRCASDKTLACIEKMGKVVSCTSSSRDDLRRILEPEQR